MYLVNTNLAPVISFSRKKHEDKDLPWTDELKETQQVVEPYLIPTKLPKFNEHIIKLPFFFLHHRVY